MAQLKNKIALITGAARGIGAGIAQHFQAAGAIVRLSDISDADGTARAATLGPNARYVSLDVTDEDQWVRAMQQILARDGRLDILVNNAGVTGFEQAHVPHDPEHASLEDWRAVHRVNSDGAFLGCKYAIRTMRQTGTGSIINMSSRSGLVGIPGAAAYAASKAAIRNHSKSVALYCAEQGLAIRCNSIHPAAILTPMWEPVLGDGPDRADRIAMFVKDTPMQRFGTVDEVAALALFLASDASSYMTGAELNLDGGMLAGVANPPRRADAS